MRSALALALSALAINSVAAAPLAAKRDNVIWHTVYEQEIVTVDVYTTVWVKPGQHLPEAKPTPAPAVPSAPAPAALQNTQAPAPAPPAPSPSTSQAAPSPPVVPSAPAAQKVETQPQPTPSAPAPVAPQQQYQAPAPTTPKPSPAPAPSPSPAPAPSPSPAPAPAPSPSPSPSAAPQGQSYNQGQSSGEATFKGFGKMLPGASVANDCAGGCSGDMTFFNPSQGLGACGFTSGATDNDDVVAIAVKMMGTLSSGDTMNPFCGRMINIKNPHNGKTATGKVVDKCFGCAGNEDIDLSPHLYDQLAAEGDGRIHDVQWSWA